MYKYLFLIFLSFIIISCNEKNEQSKKVHFRFQTSTDNYDFNRILKDSLVVQDTLKNFYPLSNFQDNIVQNFIFASSHDQGFLYKFDKNLDIIDTIQQKGPGPEEIQNPLTINAFTDELFIIDNGQYALKSYNRNTGDIKTIKSKVTFFQFSVLDDHFIYLASQKEDEHKDKLSFKSVSLKNNNIQNINIDNKSYFIEQYINHAYQGEFCSNDNYSVFYPLYGGKLIVFRNNFNNIDFLTTIDKSTKAKAKMVKVGEYSIMKTNKDDFIYLNARLDNDNNLYLMNSVSDSKEFFIDVYNLENKKYKNSFQLPAVKDQKPIDFLLIKNQLYLLYDDYTLLKCKLNK